jgi:feruloyl esterase
MRPLALAIAATLLATQAGAATCESLGRLKLPGTIVTAAVETPSLSATDPMFGPFSVNKPFCRVTGSITPAIKFEVWMPDAHAWNGKFQGVGNGGVAGSIAQGSLAAAVSRDYAAVSSNLGHDGGPIDFDFAVGHPQLVKDWGHRATHEMTIVGKAIVAAYYGKPPARAYFTGCSGGGRQGLMEAQRYPNDYDGIVAGDPTASFTRLTLGGRLWVAIQTLKDPSRYIPASKIPVIAAATVTACDEADGLKDGIIADPRECHFDPATIQCKSGDRPDCLTEGQVAALKAIYAGSSDSKGKQIFPGYMPGGELGAMGWAAYVSGTEPKKGSHYLYGGNFARFMVKGDPTYDPLTFDFGKDMPAAIAKLSKDIDATDTNLADFKARGGKLIQYHGWSDPGVSPLWSVQYYEAVTKTMGDPNGFYRLFMVPGMQHCVGGPGPDHFDALAALEQWAEHGQAPNQIIATHLTNSSAPDRTRPLCPYPQVAKWSGTGSTDDAANFRCEAAKH